MAKIHTLTYNGTKSSDLGVFVTGSGSFDAAELDVDKYEIPGRNGDLILSNNRYKNIEITYPAFIPKAFMDKAQNVRNWLRSSRVYARLEDTYDTDHYRLGIPTGVQSFEPANRNDGANFEMTFDCKPQRFWKAGETPETVEADVQTASGEIVTFETVAESPMTSAEVSLSPIQDLNGYESPWPAGGGKNKADISSATLGTCTVSGTTDEMTIAQTANYGTLTFNLKGKANTMYVFSGTLKSTSTGAQALFSVGSGNYEQVAVGASFAKQVTTDANGETYCRLRPPSGSGQTNSATFANVMIEEGAAVTAYAPYSNICPISGHTGATLYRTGKNLLDANDMVAGILNTSGAVDTQNVTIQSKGNGSVSWESTGTWRGVTTGFIDVRGNNVYRISLAETVSYVLYAWYDRNKSFISRASYSGSNMQSVTVPDNAFYVRFTFQQSAAGAYTYTNIQLELGSSATAYEPYQGDTYSVTFSDQGTVYVGTYDWASGKLTVEYGSYTFTGSESWTKWSYPWAYDTSITANGYSIRLSDIKSSAKANIISDTFVLSSTTARNLRAAVEWSLVDCCINNVVDYDYIVIRYDSITDSATFAQYMAGKTIVYELATPLEYTLSPQQIETLLGENNVWSDAGPITLTYAEPYTIENPTQYEARPLFIITNPNQGDVLSVSGKTITFVDSYTGTVTIDCETMDCYAGFDNMNYLIEATDFPVLGEGTSIVTWSGSGECKMIPRWWEL